jgi:DNA-binding NarL/FixJ family response regulator
MPMDRFQARRLDNASARTIAVQRGSDVLVWLVRHQMTVDQAAERLGATPRAVYHAWLILVPARLGEQRPQEASAVEKLLERSKETLRTLIRMGKSHEEAARVLGTSQSIVSASLSVLGHREDALRRLSRKGPEVALQSRSGLTMRDVIDMHGVEIRRMHTTDGVALKAIARELGLCRETVRRAYQEMTQAGTVRACGKLTQNDMRSAA